MLDATEFLIASWILGDGGERIPSSRGALDRVLQAKGRVARRDLRTQFLRDEHHGISPERRRSRGSGAYESTRITQLYNRVQEEIPLDEIERIHI